jgi:hypothetical protein
MLQQSYTLSIEEQLDIERLTQDQRLMAALMKMSLIREQEALKLMAQALEQQDREEALRWCGYSKAVEDFHIALRETLVNLQSKRKEQAEGTATSS